jgi:ribosomal protein S24E
MELKITNKKENPMLCRTEIECRVSFFNEPTPKRVDVKKKISSLAKADEKLIVIKKIKSEFGTGGGTVLAFVYKTEEDLKRIEPKDKKAAKPTEAAEKKAEKPAEAAEKKAEKPAEAAEKKAAKPTEAAEKKAEKPAEAATEKSKPEAKE